MSNSKYRSPGQPQINYSDTYGQLKFVYRNWRGELADRRVTPIEMVFKENEFHDGPQWFLVAYCHDKRAPRDFAIQDIVSPITPVVLRNNRVKHELNAAYAKATNKALDLTIEGPDAIIKTIEGTKE